ncbi:MAG: DUF2007 domain-containing protein [Acidiferrobacterales bacterium]|nr:DUF2007 domain-containing protein [Acidiferrobacterales bacterium]
MIRVYIAENLADAHLVCNRIRENGIVAHVFNEFSNGAVGELPFTHTWPEVWVENDRDKNYALEIVSQCQPAEFVDAERDCPECGQLNPVNFEICWSCSAQLAVD